MCNLMLCFFMKNLAEFSAYDSADMGNGAGTFKNTQILGLHLFKIIFIKNCNGKAMQTV